MDSNKQLNDKGRTYQSLDNNEERFQQLQEKEQLYRQKSNLLQVLEIGNSDQQEDDDRERSQEDPNESKTTYESCSSFNSDKEDQDLQILQKDLQNVMKLSNEQNYNNEKFFNYINESQQFENIQQNDNYYQEHDQEKKSDLTLEQAQQSSHILIGKKSKNNNVLSYPLHEVEDLPFQMKTLKLSSLKEGKLIYFEEYEPLKSNRNDGTMISGGRTISQASNSNRYSLSKTINFQMAFQNPIETRDQFQSLVNNKDQTSYRGGQESQFSNTSSSREGVQRNQNQKECTNSSSGNDSNNLQSERQNTGTQTLNMQEIKNDIQREMLEQESIIQKKQSFAKQNDQSENQKNFDYVLTPNKPASSQIKEAPDQKFYQNKNTLPLSARDLQHSYRAQSQEQKTSPYSKKQEQTLHTLNQSLLRHQQNHHSLQQRMSAARLVQNYNQMQEAQTKDLQDIQRNKTQERIETFKEVITDETSDKNGHERKWSESSNSNKNSLLQSKSNNVSFSKTIALGNTTQGTSKQKKDDQIQDLKYMLENVQCEAKNLKLLLNLKDDQLSLYETKNQDLQFENEELSQKFDEGKSKLEMIEEENLYLKAIVNSKEICEENQNQITKANIGINTQNLIQENKQCQASFFVAERQPLQNKTNSTNNVALSPIRQLIDSPQKAQNHQIQHKYMKQIAESEKENINLMNKLNDYIEKCKNQEVDYSILQTDFNQLQKDNVDLRKQLQIENNNLFWQIENQKIQMRDRDQKIREVFQLLEDTKHQTKKKSSKIKLLKKERDVLKIEILKLKQIYSDKCDNYRETREKLQKKLKKREHIINRLEDKLVNYEQNYKKTSQNPSKAMLPSWVQNCQDLNTNDFDQSNQFLKSSMRSRSLENTGNFNSTAKNHFKNFNQNNHLNNIIASKKDFGKELSQKLQDLLGVGGSQVHSSSNQQIGLQQQQQQVQQQQILNTANNYAGVQGNVNQYNAYDDFSRQQMLIKYKMQQYQRNEIIDEEKDRAGAAQNQYSHFKTNNNPNTQNQFYQNSNAQNNNHFISGDKSKSFYSSDVENNTLFDPNQILLEDQSNSSNFFSNINNSNSHLYIDESQIINDNRREKEIQQYYNGQLQNHINSSAQQQILQTDIKNKGKSSQPSQIMNRVSSQSNIKQQNQPQGQTYQEIYAKNQYYHSKAPLSGIGVIQNNKQQQQLQQQQPQNQQQIARPKKKRNDSYQFSNNQTPVSQNYLQSITTDDQQLISGYQPRCVTKSPISKNIAQKIQEQQSIQMIHRNRSSQNLSQQDLHNTTSNSIKQTTQSSSQTQQQLHPQNAQSSGPQPLQPQSDSNTSSNRALNQVKVNREINRPNQSSITNQTATTHHTQVGSSHATYQSSSSGGSKNYKQNYLNSRVVGNNGGNKGQVQSSATGGYHPSAYLTNSTQVQTNQNYYAAMNPSSLQSKHQQIQQTNASSSLLNDPHKRQRSKCLEQNANGGSLPSHFYETTINLSENNPHHNEINYQGMPMNSNNLLRQSYQVSSNSNINNGGLAGIGNVGSLYPQSSSHYHN